LIWKCKDNRQQINWKTNVESEIAKECFYSENQNFEKFISSSL